MSDEEKKLRDILKNKGFDGAKIESIIEQLKNTNNPDLLAQLLASENLGKVSEEKVYKNGNNEIPFSKTETDTTMGVDGEIHEKKKETFYASTGSLSSPSVIDKHGHVLCENEAFVCRVCFQKCCVKCAVLSVDRYGSIAIARHRECILCEHCNKPSRDLENFSDMYLKKDEYGNIVKAVHRECRLIIRIIRFLFCKNKSNKNRQRTNGKFETKYI